MSRSPILAALLLGALALGLTACADPWDEPGPKPTLVGAPAAGFLPTPTPSPESTIHPEPGTWADVTPSAGMRVVLLTTGEDEPTRALEAAVKDWAADAVVDLRTVEAEGDLIDDVVSAMEKSPDLIISAGNGLIDPLSVVSPSHLDQQFLILGADIAEPTHNVTAVEWDGASFRGTGNGSASGFDPTTFTPDRCEDAVRAGATAVLSGLSGFVLWIE